MSVLYSAYFGALRMSGGYFQFQAPQLRLLPIRQIDFTTSAVTRKAHLNTARKIYETSESDTELKTMLDFIDTELEAGRSDVVHDVLAFLADRMTEMNDEKRNAAKQFLTDLKDFHRLDVRLLKSQNEAT